MKIHSLIWIGLSLVWSCSMKSPSEGDVQTKQALPNIIIFYVDDLGFGDLSAYGAKGVRTPNVDALVSKGLKFNDAHSSAATCTPSRYSLLTGEYAFRNNAEILPGDAPLLIDTLKYTLPKMLKGKGYATAVIGKWHLGLGNGDVDWNNKVTPGPLEIGFDYSFLLPSTGDRVPTVYLENYQVVDLDESDPIEVSYARDLGQQKATAENARYLSDQQHSETLVNGVGRIGAMVGGKQAWWVDEDFPDLFTSKAEEFMDSNKDQPFFLFFSFHDIHVPRMPHDRFKGKSEMGPRGDAIVQMDWMTGKIMQHLRALGVEENTLVLFTSDNGPILNDGYEDGASEMLGSHKPAGSFRGAKYSAFEAGTRVPLVAHWPREIAPGESNALISQVDFLATIAAITGSNMADNVAIDSENMLLAITGKDPIGREEMIEESLTLGIRKGQWKYIEPMPKDWVQPLWLDKKNVETGFSDEPQLYNLDKDVSESINVAVDFPDMVNELQAKIDSTRNRSTFLVQLSEK